MSDVELTKQRSMSFDEHRERHVLLHRMLDELFADWLRHHTCAPGYHGPIRGMDDVTIGELVRWSCEQTTNPTELSS